MRQFCDAGGNKKKKKKKRKKNTHELIAVAVARKKGFSGKAKRK